MNTLFTAITAVLAATILVACGNVPKRTVLPLDHGPRAQTTPWENQQRIQRAEQEAHIQVDIKK
jgi:uncharacterized lipoprotein YmbA